MGTAREKWGFRVSLLAERVITSLQNRAFSVWHCTESLNELSEEVFS